MKSSDLKIIWCSSGHRLRPLQGMMTLLNSSLLIRKNKVFEMMAQRLGKSSMMEDQSHSGKYQGQSTEMKSYQEATPECPVVEVHVSQQHPDTRQVHTG